MKTFKLEIIGIDGTFIEEEIESLICQTDIGEISIWANHHPLISVVKSGEIKVRINGEIKTYFLPFDSILEVKENKAKILAMFH